MTRFEVTISEQDMKDHKRLIFVEDAATGMLRNILVVAEVPEDTEEIIIGRNQDVSTFAASKLSGCFAKDRKPVVVLFDEDGVYQGWKK